MQLPYSRYRAVAGVLVLVYFVIFVHYLFFTGGRKCTEAPAGVSIPSSSSPQPLLPYKREPCKMYNCFNYSRCSITSRFPVFVYCLDNATNADICMNTLQKYLGQNTYLTSDARIACLFVVFLGDIPSGTVLSSLQYWGDGSNHLLINWSQEDIFKQLKGIYKKYVGKAMVAQAAFTEEYFRPKYDVVIPPNLGRMQGDVWADCAPIAPARRKYLISFQASSNSKEKVVAELERLVNVESNADELLFQFMCESSKDLHSIETDWMLCDNDEARRIILQDSTFVLIIAPVNDKYLTTFALQLRLYEALRSGSIPVILGGDRVTLPYTEVLDWNRAVILLPLASVTELIYILKSINDADLLEFRRHGRMLWERYLSTFEVILNTLLAEVRTRLLIPPLAASQMFTNSELKEYYAAPLKKMTIPKPKEILGPIEDSSHPSPAFTRNFSISLLQGYRLWNDWGNADALFPHLPWDYPVTSEARYRGSGSGFRNIDKRFRERLGGDMPSEQMTLVILTYEREDILVKTLEQLIGLPYLNKVIVVWNGPTKPERTPWPNPGAPVKVFLSARNSLNNRFLPFDDIETEAVLCLDDDVRLGHDEIIFGFRVWRENRDQLVGLPGRYHRWNEKLNNFVYDWSPSCEISMVLTGGAFIHRYYLWAYWHHLPAAIRNFVDDNQNCEDIAMNFLVAHITRKPPVKITTKWSFGCNDCPKKLSANKNHVKDRSSCVQFFSKVMGYTPLMITQFRAVSIMHQDSHANNMCFNNL